MVVAHSPRPTPGPVIYIYDMIIIYICIQIYKSLLYTYVFILLDNKYDILYLSTQLRRAHSARRVSMQRAE